MGSERNWAQHDYYAGLLEVLSFPILPRDYALWAPALWKARDLASAAALADRLLASYVELFSQQGVAIVDLATLPEKEWVT